MLRPLLRRRAPALALALLSAALAACRGEPASPAPAPSAPGGESGTARRYEVRGEIVRLPEGGQGELSLRHEAIHDFVDRNGAVVGMNAMVMPFQVDPAASLEGLAAGDKVRVRIAVDWERQRLAIESIEELPADTALVFGKAQPPAAAPETR